MIACTSASHADRDRAGPRERTLAVGWPSARWRDAIAKLQIVVAVPDEATYVVLVIECVRTAWRRTIGVTDCRALDSLMSVYPKKASVAVHDRPPGYYRFGPRLVRGKAHDRGGIVASAACSDDRRHLITRCGGCGSPLLE